MFLGMSKENHGGCPSYYTMTKNGCVSTDDGSKLQTVGVCHSGYSLNGDLWVNVTSKDRTESFLRRGAFMGNCD